MKGKDCLYLYLQGQAVQEEHELLDPEGEDTTILWNMGSTCPATQHHNPEDLSLQSGIYFCSLMNYYANV